MKQRCRFVLILFSFLIFNTNLVNSQEIEFQKLVPADERTFDFVTGIAQDENGFMWFSTKRGLYSYDGNKLNSFKNQPLNPNSIRNNFLEAIYSEDNGKIWVGSLGGGIDLFETETGIYTHFQHDPNNPASLLNDTVTSILRDKDGILWIGTHQGLEQFDAKTKQFIHFQSVKSDPTTLSNNQIRVLYEDKQGTLWIGTGSPYADNGGTPEDGGLNRMDKKTGTFTRYLHDPTNNQSLISNKISAIYEDDKNTFWIGTALNGLHQMNRKTGTFERLQFDDAHPEKLSGPKISPGTLMYEHITFFTQDAAGSYWFGTVDAGVYYFNPKIGKINHFQGSELSPSGFTDNGAWKAFTSRDGIFWIGGTQGTIYHYNPLQSKITHIPIATAPVNSFYEEQNGTFWIGTAHDLIKNDKTNGVSQRFGIGLNPNKVATNEVYYIGKDHQGNLYVGSNQSLGIWDSAQKKFKVYQHDPKDENSISSNAVTSVYEDRQNKLWIATFRGLNLFDRETGLFTHYFLYPEEKSPFGPNLLTTVLEDKTGKLWISAWNGNGINLFNRETKTFVNYLKGSGIMYIYEDSDGILWAGGNDGLYKYNHEIDNFVRFGDFDSMTGLTNSYSMVEDNQKYLWIGTNEGIIMINPLRNETSLLDQNFGIEKNSLSWGSAFKGINGNIYFGNTTGYYVINPEEFLKNSKAPEIVFTGFYITDNIIKPDKHGPLKENLSETKEIKLRYNQNVFSFDFTVIDYANPEQNRIIYMLENYDKTWLKPSSERRAYYFNIPQGKYTFHVKVVNSAGVWTERKINIIILSPWWKSIWAYALYALLFSGLVFGFDRSMRRRIALAERRKNQEKELAQAKEIEKAYQNLEVAHENLKSTQSQLIQSEKMASLGELTAGIAHEIQNPLNFVNNFSEVSSELLDEMKDELIKGNTDEAILIANDVKHNLEKINHHGKRADSIVKGMLLHSRSSSGIKEPTDINALTDEYLRLSYHGLRAKDKTFNATMKTEFDESIGKINIVPQDIGRVLLNLINNAFYAAPLPPAGGFKNPEIKHVPTVTVKTSYLSPSGGMRRAVIISVKDNGPGIPQKVLDKIFQPFFTTKPTGEGTGLGLSMSYDIIKVHGGELRVITEEGEGSEFIIQLPL